MGMSASQARLLGLQARQSNLEYQGQQINNERTILSQQCTELYNSLLAMEVPTPPSTSDYTTIEYTGTLGATTYSFDASSVKPGANGLYSLTVNQKAYGDSVGKNPGIAKVASGGGVKFEAVTVTADKTFSADDLKGLYQNNNGTVSQVVGTENADGTFSLPAGTYYKESPTGEFGFDVQGAIGGKSVNGHALFEIDSANISDDEKTRYKSAIENSGITNDKGEPYKPSDFYIYFDDKGAANFVLKNDINDNNDNAITYAYKADGEITKPTEYNDVQLTFDPANGRITEISLPNYATITDAEGNVTYDPSKIESYTTMTVEAKQVTDELAYKDAYAQYEYDQYKYDKAQQEINAKTEVIQQEDRNLELRLQRLDNERTQITTEIEAVEKVINDNIESTYKTFSG